MQNKLIESAVYSLSCLKAIAQNSAVFYYVKAKAVFPISIPLFVF